jgi:hypothetical protein
MQGTACMTLPVGCATQLHLMARTFSLRLTLELNPGRSVKWKTATLPQPKLSVRLSPVVDGATLF